MPVGPEREDLEYQAAAKGAIASKLRNTHPYDLYKQNENPWYTAPAEMLMDPLQFVDYGMSILKLTPMARRAMQGRDLIGVTAARATQALTEGKGVAAPLSHPISELMENIPIMGVTKRSQSVLDARNLFNSFLNLIGTFNTQEDLWLILRQFVLEPTALSNGMPTASFTSAGAKLKDAGGVIQFGPAALGDYVKFIGSDQPFVLART
jgi:hypothetical protein